MKTDSNKARQQPDEDRKQKPKAQEKPDTTRKVNDDDQYEIQNDGQAGLTGDASDKQTPQPSSLRYDGSSLSDGGTWGGEATLLRSPLHGFGL